MSGRHTAVFEPKPDMGTSAGPQIPESRTQPIRVLVADKLAPEGPAFLQSQSDVEVTVQPGLSDDALAEALAAHDGVVVRSAVQIGRNVLEACGKITPCRLRAIARAGVGVDNIDLDAATRLGIAVMNSASASTITTAEHAFALLISLARNIAPAARTMADGGWDRNKFTGTQLHGKTLGVIGFGRIGQTLAERALAFGMRVIAFDPYINAESALDGRVRMVQRFEQMLPEVDAISFHVPLTDSTADMLGAEQLARMKPGALIVNAARGGIIDEAALLAALNSGTCGGAAIDVFREEPPPADDPLRAHPKVLCTPHLGASTNEAQEAVSVEACAALLQYLRGASPSGVLNLRGLELELSERQQVFTDLASRMIALLDAAAPSDAGAVRKLRVTVRGEELAARAETIGRHALAALLHRHLESPVNVINASLVADERSIEHETVIGGDSGEDRISIEITREFGTQRVDGAVFADGLPRVTNLDGYAMDMVPGGHMVLLTNTDEPGRIGVVGNIFGEANVNIAEMVIGRRQFDHSGHPIALMILRLDAEPGGEVLAYLRKAPGILSVATVELPDV